MVDYRASPEQQVLDLLRDRFQNVSGELVEQKDRVWALESQQAEGGEALKAAAKDLVHLCAKSPDSFRCFIP